MSVIILGGNECMERQYKDLCKEYKCRAKVFIKPSGSLRNKLGNPDLMICFTGALSHKVLKCAQSEIKGKSRLCAAFLRNTLSNREHDLNAASSLQNNIKHTLQQGA